ncbi:MAG: DUF697 domain-containing protein [Chloroflexota bacterium]
MTEEKSLKAQAQEIMVAVDRDLQAVEETKSLALQEEVNSQANGILDRIFGVVNDVDIEAAAKRVDALRRRYPDTSPQELSQKLIRDKCQSTGTVGAVTSGAGLIPGVGTAAAMTLGVAADIGATFKLQAELVLEIATVYDYPLSEREKQQLILMITGLSFGTSTLTKQAGQRITLKVTETVAEKALEKSVMKALPVIGVIASAGTNVLSTYLIGQRADAYFRLGPDAMESWSDSVRTVTGVDERKIFGWLADSGKATGSAIAAGASKVGAAGKVAGGAVVSGSEKVAGAVSSGAKVAGSTAVTGYRAYANFVITTRTKILQFLGRILRGIWAVITFIPRKIIGLFQRKRNDE